MYGILQDRCVLGLLSVRSASLHMNDESTMGTFNRKLQSFSRVLRYLSNCNRMRSLDRSSTTNEITGTSNNGIFPLVPQLFHRQIDIVLQSGGFETVLLFDAHPQLKQIDVLQWVVGIVDDGSLVMKHPRSGIHPIRRRPLNHSPFKSTGVEGIPALHLPLKEHRHDRVASMRMGSKRREIAFGDDGLIEKYERITLIKRVVSAFAVDVQCAD
mmetsp:Transcript_19347/g.40020  ORF Transcript_19347/g.40020 Transcript_19347/m.40020 type:complete len:213 (+) Transcript_19347:473-1111(+)